MVRPHNLKDKIRDLGNLGSNADKKAQEERLEAFKQATEALEKQYGCFYDAVLQASPKGLFPIVTVSAIPEHEYQRLKQQPPAGSGTPPEEAGYVAEASA